MALPGDPLFNERAAASRDLIRYGVIYDCFGTNFPITGLLKQSGATDILFQGTGVENAFIHDYANGSATQPGSTITPQRKQMATDSKFDERFYQANIPVEETVYKLYNAPGDTQKNATLKVWVPVSDGILFLILFHRFSLPCGFLFCDHRRAAGFLPVECWPARRRSEV